MARPYRKDHPIGQIMFEEGYTVHRLSNDANVSCRLISNYLANRTRFVPSHAIRIAEALNCDVEDLIPDTEPDFRTPADAYGKKKAAANV